MRFFLYANTRQIVKTIKKGDFFSSMPFCKGKDDQVSPLHRDFRILGSSLKGEEEGGRFKVRGGGERKGRVFCKALGSRCWWEGGVVFSKVIEVLGSCVCVGGVRNGKWCTLEGVRTENTVRWRGTYVNGRVIPGRT